MFQAALRSMEDYFKIQDIDAFNNDKIELKYQIDDLEVKYKNEKMPPNTIKRFLKYKEMISSPEGMYSKSGNYKKNLRILQNREHTFLKWLDTQEHYKTAFIILGSKVIWWPYAILKKPTQDLELEPISVKTHFDYFIAKSILAYSKVEDKSSDYFLNPKSSEVEKLSSLANKLLDTINESGLVIQEKIPHSLIRGLEN